jgi:hypothetical protein
MMLNASSYVLDFLETTHRGDLREFLMECTCVYNLDYLHGYQGKLVIICPAHGTGTCQNLKACMHVTLFGVYAHAKN